MSELFKQMLGSLIRTVLGTACGWLVTHGWINERLAGQYNTPEIAAGITGFVVVLGWSIYQKMRGVVAVKHAREMPSSTPLQTIYDQAAKIPANCATGEGKADCGPKVSGVGATPRNNDTLKP